MISSEQIRAFRDIVEGFSTWFYVLLLAQMQSGKTTTFKLVGCELLRQGIVENVVIFSGNRERELAAQIKDNREFERDYRAFLREEGLSAEEAEEIAERIVNQLIIIWGPELKTYGAPTTKTIYIWEESHHAQTQKQEVDKWFIRNGLSATGEGGSKGNLMLSVSATPFSELSDIHHLKQRKLVVVMTPPEAYVGVEKMNTMNRIHSYADPEKELRKVLALFQSGYGLIRATQPLQNKLAPIARRMGWSIRTYDEMSEEKDINVILGLFPVKPTLVFLKGMCRMGKCIDPQFVRFAMETSKRSKTDTILQGLLGRLCGYKQHEAHVYIRNLRMKEIDAFIALQHGNLGSIPQFANNMKSATQKTRHAIIPLCIPVLTGQDVNPEDILAALRTADNKNTAADTELIAEIIRTTHFKHHRNPVHYQVHYDMVKRAFDAAEAKCEFGSNFGASASEDEVIVWNPPQIGGFKQAGNVYITMQIEGELRFVVPITTKREVFCKTNAVVENSGLHCAAKPETRTSVEALEKYLVACIEISSNPDVVTSNKVTCNREKYIYLIPTVFAALQTTLKQKFQDKGVVLSWKKVAGRCPASAGTDIRLCEISWTGTLASSSLFSIGALMMAA